MAENMGEAIALLLDYLCLGRCFWASHFFLRARDILRPPFIPRNPMPFSASCLSHDFTFWRGITCRRRSISRPQPTSAR